MKKAFLFFVLGAVMAVPAHAASVVATVNGKPVTDTDITTRVELMNRMGQTSTQNRQIAFREIIDDAVKLEYAANFNAVPDDDIVKKEVAKLKLDDASATLREVALNAMRANIAWQIIVGRTILPTVSVTGEEVTAMKNELARENGLPIEMTIVRLVDIPEEVAKKLSKPKNCDAAVKMAEDLGGAPQKFTAVQYELAADIRERVAALPRLTWSPVVDDSVLLVCDTKKTAEYGQLDDMIKQNAMYKQAMFIADQQLKQLRRKAVIVINDDRYKL